MLPLALLLLACTPDRPETAPLPPLLLARHPELLVSLELPQTNHPSGEPAPEQAIVRDALERVWEDEGLEQYSADLPLSQVFYGHSTRSAPEGMSLLGPDGEPLPYHVDRLAKPETTTWRVRKGIVQLRPARGAPPPQPGELTVVYAPSATWENGLDRATAALEDTAFALRTVSVGDGRRHGLLLPAPGVARFRVTVPPQGVLDMDLRLLPPGVDRGVVSDGARLNIRVHCDGEAHELSEREVPSKRWRPEQVDLARWAGREVEIELATAPGDSAVLDRVFIANPVLYTPSLQPRHLVMIFVDTLRRDHVGFYGYDRSTTPVLDDWSTSAVIFDDARATSSWTLPSARALLTGMPQGAWGEVPTLQARLADAGFSTGAFVANAFLTHHFGMGRDWGRYDYELLAPVDEQVDRALRFLERNEDRDSAVMIQLMEPHMPYREPDAWRDRWVDGEVEELEGKINRRDLRKLRMNDEERERFESYLLARYDQNIGHMDEQLARLLDGLPPDTIVVFFSDHGEEFWDHGSVEHGHTLYDELLRVPLAVYAPGLQATRVHAPVSLLDLTPTLMELLELPGIEALHGRSLVPLARGDADAEQQAEQRPLFFGELLYDDEAWGVLGPAGLKWTSGGGGQQVFDIHQDPLEQKDLARLPTTRLERFPPLLAEALGRDVVPAWRLVGRGDSRIVRGFDGVVELRYPAGLLEVWHPPSLTGDMATPELSEGRLTITTSTGRYVPRETFVLPADGVLEPEGLELSVTQGDATSRKAWAPSARDLTLDSAQQRTFLTAGKGAGRFGLRPQWIPLPYPTGGSLTPVDSSIDAHLKALGYLDE